MFKGFHIPPLMIKPTNKVRKPDPQFEPSVPKVNQSNNNLCPE